MTAALVMPLAAKLADPDGGPAFLQIYAELLNRPRGEETLAIGQAPTSLDRWRAQVAPLLHPEAVRLHRRFTAIRLAAAELGRRAASGPHTDDRLFVGHLVDLVTVGAGRPGVRRDRPAGRRAGPEPGREAAGPKHLDVTRQGGTA